MEFEWNNFPRIHHIAARQQSPRVPVKNEQTARRIHRTNHLHVDVQRHLMGIKRQQEIMRVKCSARFSLCKKDVQQDNGHSSDLDQKSNGILLMNTVHKENGTESLN